MTGFCRFRAGMFAQCGSGSKMDRGIPSELICQLITLGMCLESPKRLATLKPGDFIDGEIGAIVHELQQMVATQSAESVPVDRFLLMRCGVMRTGKISDGVAAQVAADARAHKARDVMQRLAKWDGRDKRAWIEDVKKAIGEL